MLKKILSVLFAYTLAFAPQMSAAQSNQDIDALANLSASLTMSRAIPTFADECSRQYPELANSWSNADNSYRSHYKNVYTSIDRQYEKTLALLVSRTEFEQAVLKMQMKKLGGLDWEKFCQIPNRKNGISQLIKQFDLSRANKDVQNLYLAIDNGAFDRLNQSFTQMSHQERRNIGQEIIDGIIK